MFFGVLDSFGIFKGLILTLFWIFCALQQYKDAKAFDVSIAYSTENTKPSIFGMKTTIRDFSGWKTKYKPLGLRSYEDRNPLFFADRY